MAFPRAALYQTNITEFFRPVAFVAHAAPDDRVLAPDSGTKNLPIDVDRFSESRPIEVADSDDEQRTTCMPTFVEDDPKVTTRLAFLFPDGETIRRCLLVRVPVKNGVRRPTSVDDMQVSMWLDCGRASGDASADLADYSRHVVKFPIDSRAAATYTYTVVVTSQRTSGGLVFPVNACVTDMLPPDSQPWRGNVLVFKHSARSGWPIIGVTESSKELVNTIVSYVIAEGLVGVEDLGGQAE
ncbi:hypothetical protein B0H15DRAFT_954037 [Mycena belliarum]|uniref:Uncharacterized protein n=1 Tax=Mycena belliarum TaxID=1033014 RepID=A0AAD6XLF0_9AGAR|nr:hypothetical protein B0H15DRAFT_954037 [Mycena belliae]